MIQTGLIPAAHEDLVCDAAFDYYGTRLATAGLDQKIKIWRDSEEGGNWTAEDEWKAHDANICAISWAHPEYGSMIASCSFDRTVKIWEQIPSFLIEEQPDGARGTRWRSQNTLTDAKGSVRGVEFAPAVLGLKVASISTDNILRVYECVDLQQFNNVDTIDVAALPSTPSATPFPTNSALMTPTPSHHNADFSSISPSVAGVSNSGARPGVGIKEADGGWSLSWCKENYWGELIAVTAGTSGQVKIIQVCTAEAQTHAILTLDHYSSSSSAMATPHPAQSPLLGGDVTASASSNPERTYSTVSVSWAPSCGRSYHLIATGSRDGHVRIWKIKAPSPTMREMDDAMNGVNNPPQKEKHEWSATLVGDFADHEYAVTKVDWNITGTLLSSAGDDGLVRLWKASMGGVWRRVGEITAKQITGADKSDVMEE